ncbi:penicillin-binding protein 2 [Mesohalobacter halotolerans]|uniref:Penicillin-binding protein 2 n=1 Tax=Mesohalobacter halotolerans TaxID=1883405 RepID=A0A4U5TSS7_9FLAO|nr:penicillin-binding protein 2 [Mesohalobacter halotolerans]MBS3737722.1 penicillin-binding protein 2 [Psychroflexus sp.]TKS57380.1 penicillin-binding protein 2 [Mesohalobacter halotolerans]
MRRFFPYLLLGFTTLVFVMRLLYLQVFNNSYSSISENLAVKAEYDYPQRGYIFDRNGELLAGNQPSYDVMLVPRDLKPFDTTAFSKLLNLKKEYLIKKIEDAKRYSYYAPSIITAQLTKSEYAYLQENMYKFEGFYIQKRSLRDYQLDLGANFLGYIAEVSNRDIRAEPYYKSGDLIGRQGVEEYYEEKLRGVRGVKYIQKDRFNNDLGSYKQGQFDTLPEKGKDLTLTIDAQLQQYGKKLMKNKRGGIVALQPKTGEILSLITEPTYDPSLLIGRKRSKNYTELYYDSITRPLYNRALQAQYAPGSPFKVLTGLIALQENTVELDDKYTCYGGFRYARGQVLGCHNHPNPITLVNGIAHSCNSYFSRIYLNTINKYETPQKGIQAWHDHLKSFGLGNYLGYDLPVGRKGFIPDSSFYNRMYQYPTYKWYATATISNGIGQGEVSTTPIQLANMTAAIANRGWYIKPHILKAVDGQPIKDTTYTKKHYTTIDRAHFDPIIEGMYEVYKYGTAKWIQIPNIEIGGKTGTAENKKVIDGEVVQLKDHSIFVAFAPVDDPEIAIAVFIEHGYWGSRYAGKIASLMIEKYIKGKITRTDLEQWLLNNSPQEDYEKIDFMIKNDSILKNLNLNE